MKNTPKSIFLQIGEDVESSDWNEIHLECVFWCTERINDNDLEYVLAFALKENPEHLPDSDEIRMKARELDEKDFAQWIWELQKGNVL